jgi:hypothetical protein
MVIELERAVLMSQGNITAGNVSGQGIAIGPKATAISAQGDVGGDSYTTGQAGVVGPHSRAENLTFYQIWQQTSGDLDIAKLAEELKVLRGRLRQEADSPQQDETVAEVSKAQRAAAAGDGPSVMQHLQKAGRWALDAASAIGTTLAAAAIKAAMGI